jgi:hypothetical protein
MLGFVTTTTTFEEEIEMATTPATPATDAQAPEPAHVTLYPIDAAEFDPGLNPPTVDPNKHILLDDDAKQCSIIGDDELYASYVDRNIKTYQLDGQETWPQLNNPDKHNVILTYNDGSKNPVLVGSISLNDGPEPDQYYKSAGIIYPIDKSGAALLDATNTPNLAYIRNQYWELAKKEAATNLMFAEMVATFTTDVAGLAHAGEGGNFITADHIDGSVPTPGDTPENKVDSSGSDDSSRNQGN